MNYDNILIRVIGIVWGAHLIIECSGFCSFRVACLHMATGLPSYVFLRLRLGYERIAYPYTLGFGIDSKWLLAGLLKLNIRIPLALTILKIMASRHHRLWVNAPCVGSGG